MESAVNKEVRDVTICPICRNIYEDPKMLPCLHSFCRKCLENPDPGKQGTKRHSTGTGAESTDDQSSVSSDGTNRRQSADEGGTEQGTYERSECRICQTEYAIPAEGFPSLPSNSFVKQLTALASLSRAASKKPCEICPSSRNSVSQIYCIDCDQAMCDDCKQSHNKARVSKSHKCLVLGGLMEPEVMKDRNCYCELHPQNLLAMYCRDHKTTICFQCAAVEHRNDNCTQLSNVTEQFESQLNDDLGRVGGRLAECKVTTDKLDEIENSLKAEVSKTEAAIDKSVSECIALIKKAGDTLREQLGSWKGRNLNDIASKKLDVERFMKRIDVCRRLTEELLQKGSASDLCSTFELVKVRAQEIVASPVDCEGKDLKITRTAFFPTNLDSLLFASELKSAVGDLQFTTAVQRNIKFSRNVQDPTPTAQSLTTAADQAANGSQIPTVELDGIRSLEDARAVADLLEKKPSTIGAKRIEWQNFLEISQALQVGFQDKIKYKVKSMTLEGQSLTFHWRNEDIKPYQSRLLMLINFEDELNKKTGSQCNVSITRDGMFIRGSDDATESAKIAVFEKINAIIGTSLSTASEVQIKLMKRVAVQEYVHGICQQRDIKATLASDPILQVCAFDEQESAKLESMLPSIIKELEFAFDVSDAIATSLSDELKNRKQEIEFNIDAVQKNIRIACLDKDESQIQEFVEQFIRHNSRVEKCVSISEQVKDYILRHKAEEFYRLKEHFQNDGGSLVCSEDAVTLKGKCTVVDSAEAQLRMMADSLVGKSYTVDHPAGESFLRKTTAGKLIVKGIECEDKALITVKSTTQGSSTSDSEAEFVSSAEITSSPECTILMRLANSKGNVVTVVGGHIESQKVDAIVNSVERNLRLDVGDISSSIFAAAGPSLLAECKRKAPVEFGKIVCTIGYNLPCKHVYHGVAANWDGGKGRSKKILAEVIKNCLVQAHTGALRSIAFPAIGAGILKFPEDVVIDTLLEEIETFNMSHPATTLKDIRFVINSEVLKSKLDSFVSQGGAWRKLERRPLKSNPIKTSLAILASSEQAADDVCKKIEDILKEH